AMAATYTDGGYWLLGADGGIFNFGDAGFHGSASPEGHRDFVGITPTGDGGGYYLVRANGCVETFGDAQRFADANGRTDMCGQNLGAPVTGLSLTSDGLGCGLEAQAGRCFAFG